jgi:hypothetical protein
MSLESQLSIKKRIKSATERLEAIEGEVPRLIAGVNNGFSNLETRLNEMTEILNAIAQLHGEAEVSAKVAENRIERAVQAAQRQKEGLEKAIIDGRVVVTDTVGPKSVVVCKETDKDGNATTPGRVQLEFGQIRPEFQEKFLGKGTGVKVEAPNGNILEVVEVYNLVDPPPQAANSDAAPTPAADASAPAADVTDAPPADAAATQPPAQA